MTALPEPITSSYWQTIDSAPEGEIVMTRIDDGRGVRNEQPLIRQGRLWFVTDRSMYVYYTPTHWGKINWKDAQ